MSRLPGQCLGVTPPPKDGSEVMQKGTLLAKRPFSTQPKNWPGPAPFLKPAALVPKRKPTST